MLLAPEVPSEGEQHHFEFVQVPSDRELELDPAREIETMHLLTAARPLPASLVACAAASPAYHRHLQTTRKELPGRPRLTQARLPASGSWLAKELLCRPCLTQARLPASGSWLLALSPLPSTGTSGSNV